MGHERIKQLLLSLHTFPRAALVTLLLQLDEKLSEPFRCKSVDKHSIDHDSFVIELDSG